jgi:hypothetical protein
MMTAKQFEAALDKANPGEAIPYHRGVNLEECKAASAALRAYYEGRCELVQKRLTGPFEAPLTGNFQYLAIKRRYTEPPDIHPDLSGRVARLVADDEREVSTNRTSRTKRKETK